MKDGEYPHGSNGEVPGEREIGLREETDADCFLIENSPHDPLEEDDDNRPAEESFDEVHGNLVFSSVWFPGAMRIARFQRVHSGVRRTTFIDIPHKRNYKTCPMGEFIHITGEETAVDVVVDADELPESSGDRQSTLTRTFGKERNRIEQACYVRVLVDAHADSKTPSKAILELLMTLKGRVSALIHGKTCSVVYVVSEFLRDNLRAMGIADHYPPPADKVDEDREV